MISIGLVALVGCIVVVVAVFRRGRAPMDLDRLSRTLDVFRGHERVALTERDARLERLEQAVDVMAVEVERIGEGQRFLTKVLAERAPDQ